MEGYLALVVAILKECHPEQAFLLLDKPDYKQNFITEADILDMIKLKSEMTFRELGEMYGISGEAAYRRIKNYKERVKKNEC